jgi:hypothetical protein
MGESISHALREALFSMHSADRHLRSELRTSICNTTVADGQSCRVWRTLLRRPQRPGNQSRAEARSWRIPPSHSPSRIAGHRRLCRNALAGHAERLARCQHCAPAPVFASSTNPDPFVQKLWMPAIPCGSAWKIRTLLSSSYAGACAGERFLVFYLTPPLGTGARASKRIRAGGAENLCSGRT